MICLISAKVLILSVATLILKSLFLFVLMNENKLFSDNKSKISFPLIDKPKTIFFH